MVFVKYKLFILFHCFHDIASWTKLTFKLLNCLKLLIFKRRQIAQNAFDLLKKKYKEVFGNTWKYRYSVGGHFAAGKSCKTILLHSLGKTFQTSWCTRFYYNHIIFNSLMHKMAFHITCLYLTYWWTYKDNVKIG